MTRRARSMILLAVAGFVAACDGTARVVPGQGPTATLVDSIVLQDPDTLPRDRGANVLARSTRGDLFILVTDRVQHFGSSGALVGTMGTAGEGPGELDRATGVQVLPGDSLLAVVSTSRRRIVVFRIADGSVIRDVPTPEAFVGGQGWTIIGDTALIPTQLDDVPFRRWVIPSDAVTEWGAPPPSMGQLSFAYMQGGLLSGARYGDGLLALVPGDSMLVLHDHAGGIRGRVLLPARRRRTVPADINDQYRVLIRKRPPEFKLLSPFVLGIHRRADGTYLMVHFDAVSTYHDDPVRFEFTEPHYWVSLLSADLSEACVDGELPNPPDDVSPPMFIGDTVALLIRGFAEDGAPTTVLRSYLIAPTGCDWQPTGGVNAR